ncbi:MAG: hypothetical protein VW907_03080 [Opitutae bacterium]|jgi:hypothetical protein
MDFNEFLKEWAKATMLAYATPKRVTACCGTGEWISEEDVGYMCLKCGNRSYKSAGFIIDNPKLAEKQEEE